MATSNQTDYSTVYDPETLIKLIGVNWILDSKLVRSGLINRVALPVQGTLTTDIVQKTFQNSTGQALKMNDEIAAVNKQQQGINMPNLWRYSRLILPEAWTEIEAKNIKKENADMATAIQNASAQYVDDSLVKTTEGVAAALTANQTDNSAAISLTELNNAKKKTADRVEQLNGGVMIIKSDPYYDLVGQGLLAQTANTFGNDHQNRMVSEGELPTTILNMSALVTDKLVQETGQSTGEFYTYLVASNTLMLKGSGAPSIKIQPLPATFVDEIKFKVRFGVGVDFMAWQLTGKEDVSDSELSTGGNWVLATNSIARDVPIYRLQSTNT